MSKKEDNIPMEIGDQWIVYGADFDADDPFIVLAHTESINHEIKMPIPKKLAYYLNTHWCGSKKMHDIICKNAQNDMRESLKEILGLNETKSWG